MKTLMKIILLTIMLIINTSCLIDQNKPIKFDITLNIKHEILVKVNESLKKDLFENSDLF